MKRWNARSIEQYLVKKIESGKYLIGTTLPSRTILAKRFGVARATVDNAVRSLADRGMVQSRRGAGSIIINTSRRYNFAFIGISNDKSYYPRNDVSITPLSKNELTTLSEREKLQDFDGVIWNMPEQEQIGWASLLPDNIPQIILNRMPEIFNYVSTDHVAAIFQITDERLENNPGWLPVFLDVSENSSSGAVKLRQDGFIKACRKHRVFYESVNMPSEFEDKIDILKEMFDTNSRKKLLIVSGSRENTGAVVTWVRETKRQWQKDILYSDFDNDLPENIWGITVTSFLQDYSKMLDLAITSLIDIIRGNKKDVHILQPPLWHDGIT